MSSTWYKVQHTRTILLLTNLTILITMLKIYLVIKYLPSMLIPTNYVLYFKATTSKSFTSTTKITFAILQLKR